MTTVKLVNIFHIITILGVMSAPEIHPLRVLLAFEAVLLSLVIKHLSTVHYCITAQAPLLHLPLSAPLTSPQHPA